MTTNASEHLLCVPVTPPRSKASWRECRTAVLAALDHVPNRAGMRKRAVSELVALLPPDSVPLVGEWANLLRAVENLRLWCEGYEAAQAESP